MDQKKYIQETAFALVLILSSHAGVLGQHRTPAKVSHIEPLYIDLARDLGARKGEKEINIGAEFANEDHYKKYLLLAEYEWAPINRLGLEVEADLVLFGNGRTGEAIPGNKIESVKFSAQYTFFVSQQMKLSMAGGYTQLFELPEFRDFSKNNFLSEFVYNPFFVTAKRWGSNFHTMIYFSSLIKQSYQQPAHVHYDWQLSTSVHYALPQGKYSIGLECNSAWTTSYHLTLRPQMKMQASGNLAVGFVAGIPIVHPSAGFSSFIRLIYEL